jgi:hypothetical protein
MICDFWPFAKFSYEFYGSKLCFVVFRQTSYGHNRGENTKGYAWDCHACVDTKSCIDLKSLPRVILPLDVQYSVT